MNQTNVLLPINTTITKKIINDIVENPTINSLSICFINGYPGWLKDLSKTTTLKKLHLHDKSIDPNELIHLFQNKSITYLSLNIVEISGLEYLAKNSTIETFCYYGSEIFIKNQILLSNTTITKFELTGLYMIDKYTYTLYETRGDINKHNKNIKNQTILNLLNVRKNTPLQNYWIYDEDWIDEYSGEMDFM